VADDPTSNIARRRAAAQGDARPEYVERRREIVRAASRVFKARGFRGTTLGHVAELLGVDRASLYYYYSSKEELFQDIVADTVLVNTRTAETIRDSSDPSPVKLRRLIQDMMRSYEEHYPVLYVLIQENLSQVALEHSDWAETMKDIQKSYEAVVIEIVQAGMEDGSIRASAPAWLIAYGIIGTVGWTNRWFTPNESPVTGFEVGTAFADMLLDGLVLTPS
jgi:TetR/AcrR family transcriptional regulator, cholesterol catabolism regulator